MTIRAHLRENRTASTRHVAIVSAAVPRLVAAAGCNQSPHPTAVNSASKVSVTKVAPTPPPAPGSLTAVAVGSVPLVAQLHDTATLLTRHTGLPAGTRTPGSASLKGRLTGLAKRSAVAPWPDSRLRKVLLAYPTLGWAPKPESATRWTLLAVGKSAEEGGPYTSTTVSGGSDKVQFLAPCSTCEMSSP